MAHLSKDGVVMCGPCGVAGLCRTGILRETLVSPEELRAEAVCGPSGETGRGVAHGGWTATVLDEVMGHLPTTQDMPVVTARMTVEYLKPVPAEQPLEVTARVVSVEGRKWTMTGEVRLASSGALLARGEGLWIARDMNEHFAEHRAWLNEQG